jgi:Laminin B (Domain IV)/PEP-CTERM motif
VSTFHHCLMFLASNLIFTGVQAAGVASTFDTDADGWYVSDLLGNGTGTANWISGVIQTADQFAETSFHAPARFNGDWSSLYGSTLSFDLTEVGRDSGADDYYTVIVASGTNVLYWYGGAPLTTFSTFVAPLTEQDSRWRLAGTGFNPASGTAPTAAQFQSILGDITRLQINAEFITGADNTRLDNVIFGAVGAVPEPQTYLLFSFGICAVAMRARRKSARVI